MIVNRYLKTAKKPVKVELEKIKDTINEPLKEVELEVNGMTCESCASTIRSIIEYHGGTDVFVNLEKNNAKCLIPISKRPEELIKRINESGFTARIKDIKRII
jgi:copper chaperone CopZ